MAEYLQQLHPIKYTEDSIFSIMTIFHQNISSSTKKLILAGFQKPGEFSRIWIIFMMEAIGISVNFPNVQRVVIYIILSPKPHFSPLLQHGS